MTHSLSLGQLDVRSGSLMIGDCWFPPRGVRIAMVPRGVVTIFGTMSNVNGDDVIASISATFREARGSCSIKDEEVSVDGVLLMISDPAVADEYDARQQRQIRRGIEREIQTLLSNLPLKSTSVTLKNDMQRKWGLVLKPGYGDGLYGMRIVSDSAGVVAFEATFV